MRYQPHTGPPAPRRATSHTHSQDCLDSPRSQRLPCSLHLHQHSPGINSEMKQTWPRPIKLISSHFKLSISNGCFMDI